MKLTKKEDASVRQLAAFIEATLGNPSARHEQRVIATILALTLLVAFPDAAKHLPGSFVIRPPDSFENLTEAEPSRIVGLRVDKRDVLIRLEGETTPRIAAHLSDDFPDEELGHNLLAQPLGLWMRHTAGPKAENKVHDALYEASKRV